MSSGEYSTKISLPQMACCPTTPQTFTVRLEAITPSGGGAVTPAESRVEIAAPANAAFAPGVLQFTNGSASPVTGRVVSDVAWLQPLVDNPLTIAPGATEEVAFALNRDTRPDVLNPAGSEVGTMSFIYASTGTTAASGRTQTFTSGASTTSVGITVIDTITLPTSQTPIPPLASGEVALLLPGMGNVLGSVGQFVSDLSLFNRSQTNASNLRFFFAPA
ncbi:MAG: hypothetical protein ACHQQR_03215, partial [Gemmatimonadales bacterium]